MQSNEKTSQKKRPAKYSDRRKLKSRSRTPVGQTDAARTSEQKQAKDSKVGQGKFVAKVDYKDWGNIEESQFKKRPGMTYTGYGWTQFTTGEKFYGFFTNGVPNGIGTFYGEDSKQLTGKWKEGRLA